MCCAFNAESALKKSTYLNLVQNMQTLSNPTSTSGDGIRKIKTGEQNGLTLWLDQHSDKTSFGTIYDDYNGFKVTLEIHDSRLQPVVDQSSVSGVCWSVSRVPCGEGEECDSAAWEGTLPGDGWLHGHH